jgi:transposase
MNRKARRGCGIDVHKASLSACLRLHGKGRKVSEEIRTFGTTGDQLLALHDWLKEREVTEVAMEATGVYWKPVYYVLEDGLRVILVNPAEIKRMPGRKTDVSDCAWLAQLLDNGMLRPSFIPPRRSASCGIWCVTVSASSTTIRASPIACTRYCRMPTSSSPA